MQRQLRFQEVVEFMVVGTQGQLVDAQFVQPQQLHQHAVEVGELVVDDALLGYLALRFGQLRHPLPVGMHQVAQGVFHVVHGGGDHHGKVEPRVLVCHWPNALLRNF
ncbi:hypothetical protein D9M71_153100 [compost metagenome]